MLPDSDAIIREVAEAASALVRGDEITASEAISRLAHEPQQSQTRPTLPRATIARVLWRDRCRCRYCERACLPHTVLRLVSAVWPEAFPYDPHWKTDRTHVAYWIVTASVDHIRAGTMGGDWLAENNLATACWPCQQAKGNTSLERLGWTLHDVRLDTSWDGLLSSYGDFWRAAGSPDPRIHLPWIRAYDAARHAASREDT